MIPAEPLSALLPDEVARALAIDIVDARRIWSRIQKEGALPHTCPATIRRLALDKARAHGEVPRLVMADRRASSVDPFVKYAFSTDRGAIETVRIPLERSGRYSVCVSSQVGCALACAFCATGRMGLLKNLEVWEIVDQVRSVRAELEGGRIHGLVFQGMGEPLANCDRVIRAVRILTDPSGLAIDQRNVTICTSGLPSGIRRVAEELPAARLGLSIGDARPGRRAALMPIDETHPLDEVLGAVGEHTRRTGYAPMWAYTLLADINDREDAALALADRARDFAERYGVRPRVSLIPYNDVEGAPFVRASREVLERFRDVLGERGVGSIVRYSGGGDIGAACGQLVTIGASRGKSGLSKRATGVADPPVAGSPVPKELA